MAKRPFTFSVVRAGKRADIRLEGPLSELSKANAAEFQRQVNDLVAAGVRDAHVYMDGPGGNVFEANRIANAIKKFPGNLTGEGGAMIASAYTYIGLQLKDFRMPKNGMYMIHKPGLETAGNEDQLKADLQALEKHTQNYRAAYAQKTGKTEAQIEAMWKQENWMTAEEAVAEGFIDGITDEVAIDQETVTGIAACGCPKDKLPTASAEASTNNDDMDIKAMRTLLGMPETATEAEVLAKVKELNDLKARTEGAAQAARTAEVKALIDKAIEDKRITEEHRKGFEAKFSASFDATKAELEAIKPVVSMKEVADGAAAAAAGTANAEDRKGWTYRDYQEKDPEGFKALARKDKAKAEALATAYYGAKVTLPDGI